MRDDAAIIAVEEGERVLQHATLYVAGKQSETHDTAHDDALLILVCAWCQITARRTA